jgi:hypothetical protein
MSKINKKRLCTKTVTYFTLLELMMPFYNHMGLSTGQMQQMKVSLSVCNANHDITSLIFSNLSSVLVPLLHRNHHILIHHIHIQLTRNITGCCKIPSRAHLYDQKTASVEVRNSRLQSCYNTLAWH